MRHYSILLLALLSGATLLGCGSGSTKVEPVTLTPEEERKLEKSMQQAAQQESQAAQKAQEPAKKPASKPAQ